MSFKRLLRFKTAVLFLCLWLTACGASNREPGSLTGKEALLRDVDNALTNFNCGLALSTLMPVYDSVNTDNTVRMRMASAYACYTGFKLIPHIDDLANNMDKLTDKQFWRVLARQFNSTSQNDRMVEAAQMAVDALLSVRKQGTVTPPQYEINSGSHNPGSVFVTDRQTDANIYLVFMAMANLGSVGSRYGVPNANYVKTKALPWNTAAKLEKVAGKDPNQDGCSYASAMVNFADALDSTVVALKGSSAAKALEVISQNFKDVIYAACDEGCTNGVGWTPGWVQSGCTITTSCASCPIGLRDRTKCTGATDDQVSCAAAGIVNFINTDPLVGWN